MDDFDRELAGVEVAGDSQAHAETGVEHQGKLRTMSVSQVAPKNS